MNRLGRIGKGLAALVVVIVLVVGAPWALWHFIGWPLPHNVPNWSGVRRTLEEHGIPDVMLLKSLAVVVWLTWILLVVSLAAEVVASMRGLTVTRVAFGGPFQALASALVAAIIVSALTTMARSAPADAPSLVASLQRNQPVVARLVDAAIPTTRASPDRNNAAVDSSAATGQVGSLYVVVPGDTLWDIAQRHLGDPLRWLEIYQLNEGKRQVDGRELGDPHWIYPGWQLELPPSMTEPRLAPVKAPSQSTPTAHPRPVMAPSPAASPATVPPTTRLLVPPTSVPPATSKHPAAASRSHTHREGRNDDYLLLGVAGLTTAVGLAGALNLLRRRQLKRRRPGRAAPPLAPELAATEIAVRALADNASGSWLEVALRSLSGQLRVRRGDRAPHPVAVQLRENNLVVMLEEPSPDAPKPWTTTPLGWLWELPRSISHSQLESAARDGCAPMPALATIGRGPDGPVMVDLEACGLACVTGSSGDARALARSVALELTVSPIADSLEVLVVSAEGLLLTSDAAPRLRVLDNLDAAIDVLDQQVRAIDRALNDQTLATTFQARVASRGSDPWAPVVLILDRVPADPKQRERIERLTNPASRGVGVLAVGDWAEAPWVLNVNEGRVDVARLGVAGLEAELDVQTVEADVGDAVMQLLDQTLDETDEPLLPAAEPTDANAYAETDEPARVPELPLEVEVRVLGDVEVIGGTGSLTERETELVAFLATRDQAVDADTVQTALWPQRMVSAKRWWNIVADTRRALGTATDGEFHFPPVAQGERLRLRSTVGTDLGHLQRQLRAAANDPPDAAIVDLTAALEVVRGRPFAAAHGYAWANAYGLVAHAEAVVVDAAHLLASLLLDAGNPAGALDATALGLRGAPANEILYRDRMLAHHDMGNISGIDGDIRDLCAALDVDDPCDELHPETLELYEQLTHRAPRQARTEGVRSG